MTRLSNLLARYEAQLGFAWDTRLHGAEKTWFAVYNPEDERRLQVKLGEFELATARNGKKWRLFDVTSTFETWLSESEYRDEYFRHPEYLEMQYSDFEKHLLLLLLQQCEEADENTVLAISSTSFLYGFMHISSLVGGIADAVSGRLLVFFPGSVEASTYRFLNARDGWNYRAVVISATR